MEDADQKQTKSDKMTVLGPDQRSELAEKTKGLEQASLHGIPVEIIKAITSNPRGAQRIVDAYVILSLRDNPSLLSMYADSRRRSTGMWIGATLTSIAVAGAVALLVISAPALIGLALLSLGAACAGGTFAIITGKSVSPADFVKLIQAFRANARRRNDNVQLS